MALQVLQNVPSDSLIWLIGGIVAGTALLEMMRLRQIQLNSLLRSVIEKKLEWAKKKAKAAHLARIAAERKVAEEAAFKLQLAEVGEESTTDLAESDDPYAPVLF